MSNEFYSEKKQKKDIALFMLRLILIDSVFTENQEMVSANNY